MVARRYLRRGTRWEDHAGAGAGIGLLAVGRNVVDDERA
jgi:hypothetical protein